VYACCATLLSNRLVGLAWLLSKHDQVTREAEHVNLIGKEWGGGSIELFIT